MCVQEKNIALSITLPIFGLEFVNTIDLSQTWIVNRICNNFVSSSDYLKSNNLLQSLYKMYKIKKSISVEFEGKYNSY